MTDQMPNNPLDVAIVGLGPAGIAAAHHLSKSCDGANIACFEMGPKPERQACPVLRGSECLERTGCHILTGFGGSSVLSGGKLSTLPAGDSLIDITQKPEKVKQSISRSLDWFNNYLEIQEPNIDQSAISYARDRFSTKGFDFDYYDAHVMTGSESEVIDGYSEMYSKLSNNPISLHFNAHVKKVEMRGEDYVLSVEEYDGDYEYLSDNVILAVGIPGENLLKNLKNELDIDARDSKLELGIRLEFPSDLYSDIDKAHNDLKLHRGDCRTFCVCKGGQLSPYYLDGISVLDGHVDRSNLTSLTNLGIRLRLPPQEENETIYNNIRSKYLNVSNGVPLRQSYLTYINTESPSLSDITRCSMNHWQKGDVNDLFPKRFADELRENISRFVDILDPKERDNEISVYAPELYYPGLEFNINHDFSVRDGFYIIGEGTGKFRGILQAFSSGLLCAEAIVESQIKQTDAPN